MKRWFIARMGDYENEGTLVPKTNLYGANGLPISETNTIGCNTRIWSKSGFDWCFGQIAASNFADMQSDTDIFILPDGTLDLTLSSIPGSVRTNMRTRLENAGFSFTGVAWTWSVRELLVFLLQQLQPALDTVEQGDVHDIEG